MTVSSTGSVTSASEPGYRDCTTVAFADFARGLIARSPSGAPKIESLVRASDGRFTGPCTYAEGATAIGMLVPMQFTSAPVFRVFPTSIKPR